jgi:hypothetical protein
MSDREIVAHIIAPHEDTSLLLSDLVQMGNDLLTGKVENIEEKIDGQNLTFTVINSELQFFNKGLNPSRLSRAISGEQPGIMLRDMNRYSKDIRSSFEFFYKELAEVLDENVGLTEKTFQNGKFVIEGAMLTNSGENTVTYRTCNLIAIQFVSMFGDTPDTESYSLLMEKINEGWSYMPPSIKSVPILEYSEKAPRFSFEQSIEELVDNVGLNMSHTVGDLNQKLTEAYLKANMNIPIGLVEDASRRLALSQKSALSHRSFSDKKDWKRFQEIEERHTVAQASLAPFEEILQRLTFDVMEQYPPQQAGQVPGASWATIDRVTALIEAAQDKNIKAPKRTLDRINDTIKRLNQRELYRNAEGIVFEYKGQLYKLTGIFTPINKILGYFKYDDAKVIKRRKTTKL